MKGIKADNVYAGVANYLAISVQSGEKPASELERRELYVQVGEIGKLEANWDGFGALPISQKVLDNAYNALPSLLSILPCPDISANPNGTISFEWQSDQAFASLELGATRYSLVVLTPTYEPLLLGDGDAGDVSVTVAFGIGETLFPTLPPSSFDVPSRTPAAFVVRRMGGAVNRDFLSDNVTLGVADALFAY